MAKQRLPRKANALAWLDDSARRVISLLPFLGMAQFDGGVPEINLDKRNSPMVIFLPKSPDCLISYSAHAQVAYRGTHVNVSPPPITRPCMIDYRSLLKLCIGAKVTRNLKVPIRPSSVHQSTEGSSVRSLPSYDLISIKYGIEKYIRHSPEDSNLKHTGPNTVLSQSFWSTLSLRQTTMPPALTDSGS